MDIYHEFVGAVIPAGRHRFGVSLTYLGMPDQKVRTIARPEGNGKFYSASDLALAVSWGFQFTDQFAMGVTTKYIRQQIYNSQAFAWAVDFGAHYQPTNIKWLQLGMQIANFGTDLKYSGHDLDQKVDIDPSELNIEFKQSIFITITIDTLGRVTSTRFEGSLSEIVDTCLIEYSKYIASQYVYTPPLQKSKKVQNKITTLFTFKIE